MVCARRDPSLSLGHHSRLSSQRVSPPVLFIPRSPAGMRRGNNSSARLDTIATPRPIAPAIRPDESTTPSSIEILATPRRGGRAAAASHRADNPPGRPGARQHSGDDSNRPRSLDPDSSNESLTNPRLSPRHRSPRHMSTSSRPGSRPRRLAPLSGAASSSAQRHSRSLTRTNRLTEAASPGKHLYDAVRNGEVK